MRALLMITTTSFGKNTTVISTNLNGFTNGIGAYSGDIFFCDGNLSETHKARLSSLGCQKEIDHTFVSVALNSDKVLLTEDRAFGKGPKGDQPPHSDALRYLTDTMGIDVYDAQEAVEQLEERKLKQRLKELDQERVLEVL